jgi:hypothetical protein
MSDKVNFIEVESEEPCGYCGRKKLSESEKFYKVFVGDKDFGMVICELCKGGFLTRFLEGPEGTHATHLIFYVKRSLCGLEEKLPKEITRELNSAIENYEAGEYSASFRSIGFVAEWLTERLFTKRFGESPTEEKLSWENALGRLLEHSRKNKNKPEEALVHQLFSLKWFRNKAGHPSKYKITGEDVRLGLMSVVYLIHQTYLHNLI